MEILVTGGAGFIGSALVRYLIRETPHGVVNLDALTYAGDLSTVGEVTDKSRYQFYNADIVDGAAMHRIFAEHQPDAVMNLAAETHVDRSIDRPADFISTNVVGTYTLLEAARAYWERIPSGRREAFRFHHVSTDEVFGELGREGRFSECTPYRPSSPYAASKAASDHLVRAWHRTYGLPVVLSNCSNNYGPYQFPEKLIPLTITRALKGKPLPVYGNGSNVRDWLYVEDHARAMHAVLTQGRPGESYNVGGDSERTNLQVVQLICGILDDLRPGGGKHSALIEMVPDRPGHDFRYAIDATKIRSELGWRPSENFESGLEKTVRWYLDHQDWSERIAARYDGRRLGLVAGAGER